MLQDITLGQYVETGSWVHRLDPRTKILLTTLWVVVVFLLHSWQAYLLLAAFFLLAAAAARLPFRFVLRGIRPLVWIILLTVVLNMFMTEGEPLWRWGSLVITKEGLSRGWLMGARLVLLLLVTSLLTLTTSPISLTDGLERLLAPGRRIGIPAHELAMMMTIALRFIPTLLEETDRIMKAQMARGANFERGNLVQRARNLIPLLVPLFVSAFRRADDLATAMEARCYRGGEGRTRFRQLVLTWQDGAVLVGNLALTLLLLLWR